MNSFNRGPRAKLGFNFVDPRFLPAGVDEFYLRHKERPSDARERSLTRSERRILEKQGNRADDWNNILVGEGFAPHLIRNCTFMGLNRIGAHSEDYLEFHDLRLPVGMSDSTVVSCDIGNDAAIHHVHYLSHYVIGNEVILFNIDEMLTSNYAKFGNGIIKDGEEEDVRIWLEVGNENGGRSILPFDGLTPADAYIWSQNRDNHRLLEKLKEMTGAVVDNRRGHYGSVGDRTVIKSCRVIKDVRIGDHAYIKGANKLKNLTIKSRADAGTQIGEGVELVNGIIEIGCRIFYGVKAVRFCLRTNASLKYGARLINSILGDNGTISCCEVLNSIVFPSHEQHHNNSFLVAATIQGQSNIAAGATLGSNHNSRANDGEIFAERGFWPGLSVTLKHPCKFASFCIIAKGNYPKELHIPLPFTLVSRNEKDHCLQLMPGYWFLYNMYALTRNSWKYAARDGKLNPWQQYEYDYLAPDTIEELFKGMELLEMWAGRYELGAEASNERCTDEGRELLGKTELSSDPPTNLPTRLKVNAHGVEAGTEDVIILKIEDGYHAFREMIHYYGISNIARYFGKSGKLAFAEIEEHLGESSRTEWCNLGGQLVRKELYQAMLKEIETGGISTWDALHEEYKRCADSYAIEKAKHAYASLLSLHRIDAKKVDSGTWNSWLDTTVKLQRKIVLRTRESREKDYQNEFKRMMYSSDYEMTEVLGTLDTNGFLRQMEEETGALAVLIDGIRR